MTGISKEYNNIFSIILGVKLLLRDRDDIDTNTITPLCGNIDNIDNIKKILIELAKIYHLNEAGLEMKENNDRYMRNYWKQFLLTGISII